MNTIRNFAGSIAGYVIGLLFGMVARFIPNALDKALKGLNDVEALLAKAAAKAQAKMEAEEARRTALWDQFDASWLATEAQEAILKRSERVRSRINDLLA